MKIFSGFTGMNRGMKLDFVAGNSLLGDDEAGYFRDFDAPESGMQQVFEGMIENYIGNYPVPMGVVPNMLINGELFMVPFVTEESSVVAAASKAAKYWANRGGFKAQVVSSVKKGQVHFTWNGPKELIFERFPEIKKQLLLSATDITFRMRRRGGGITDIALLDKTSEIADYYQLDLSFETADAMGANFINSCLERTASTLSKLDQLNNSDFHVEIIMAILSNYTPGSIVQCRVECPAELLTGWNKSAPDENFVLKFMQAVDIANLDVSRAVTHNKGIFNGVDAALLATGNDWRAAEAAGHAYAARNGQYKGLTTVSLENHRFSYELELPLAVGTVGGITSIHPLVRNVHKILRQPDARKLMMIVAASGLASNFAAIASLVTTGIQEGHMKLHLSNMLNQLNASVMEMDMTIRHFSGKGVSYAAVEDFIRQIRSTP
jgi:hydroxymethylglutaryl-CoA reductase